MKLKLNTIICSTRPGRIGPSGAAMLEELARWAQALRSLRWQSDFLEAECHEQYAAASPGFWSYRMMKEESLLLLYAPCQ